MHYGTSKLTLVGSAILADCVEIYAVVGEREYLNSLVDRYQAGGGEFTIPLGIFYFATVVHLAVASFFAGDLDSR